MNSSVNAGLDGGAPPDDGTSYIPAYLTRLCTHAQLVTIDDGKK